LFYGLGPKPLERATARRVFRDYLPTWSGPMLRTILAGYFALSLAMMPQAMAQQEQAEAPAAEIDRGVVGLPIHTSDGHEIGLVTEAGIDDGEAILIGEIERPLGLGPDVVVITKEMFVNRGDHIELTITAEQVRDRLARPEQ